MLHPDVRSGFAEIGDARLYYEIAGEGQPFIMIHAGVADSRQWNNEFPYFSQHYRVLRYDMRGYGRSKPVDGEFRHIDDLHQLLDQLAIYSPAVLMGCSMGGGLAMNFALEYPDRAAALIMVGSAPTGLELDVPKPAQYAQAEEAYEARDWDLLCELETQIWFDGEGRLPEKVDASMRRLAYEMNRQVLAHEASGLGKRLPDVDIPAVGRLDQLKLPVLVIVGKNDTPYIRAAADYMLEHIPSSRKMMIEDAGHLSNMDHPQQFREIVENFLADIPRSASTPAAG
jgi:pimeloyl-ACP methyl ester carboxylesterase